MRDLLAALAGVIAFYGYIPYGIDIVRGKVRPARSARIMLTLLLLVTLLQQRDLGSGWLLSITVGEVVGALGILVLGIRKGMGGLSIIDVVCYVLLAIDLGLWLSTKHTLLALHLSILADFIAFTPTLVKTWRHPWTETPLYFMTMVIASPLNIIAIGTYRYSIVVFPAYLGVINLLEVIVIFYRQHRIPMPHGRLSQDHQPLN
jgi:hypothetical protein